MVGAIVVAIVVRFPVIGVAGSKAKMVLLIGVIGAVVTSFPYCGEAGIMAE